MINNRLSVAQELVRLHIWMKDHPPSQVIGNPNIGVKTRSSFDIENECHFVAFISFQEPKTIKEALDHSN